MNKIRVIAVMLLIIGIILPFLFETNAIDLISGVLIGLGIGLFLSNKITRNLTKSKIFQKKNK